MSLRQESEEQQMKSKARTVFIYILLFVGVGILNYPGISSLYNRLHEGEVISGYEDGLNEITATQLAAMLEEARAYNERLRTATNAIVDAFSEAPAEQDDEYNSLVNVSGDGVMGYIEIPGINVNLPIMHGVSMDVLEKAAGHLRGSSLPVGGESTHAIISAHRGLPSAILFSDVDQLRDGDVFYIHVLGEVLAYQVNQIKVVLPTEVSDVQIEEGEDYVTLLTCTPYAINSHRLLIRGTRIPYTPEEQDVIQKIVQSVWGWLLQQKILLISAAVLLLSLIIIIVRSIRDKIKKKRIKG